MTQLTLNIEDKSILPSLREIIPNGVTICKQKTRRTVLNKALEDQKQANECTKRIIDNKE